MRVQSLLVTFSFLSLCQRSDLSELETIEMHKFYKQVRNLVFLTIGKNATPRGFNKAARFNLLQRPVPRNVPFPCDTSNARSPTPPTSVHQVRPGDIDVVAAMGDSLTSANGALSTDLIELAIENRGVSWCIGGQGTWREFLTIPNILKEFNPNLIGYSFGDSLGHHWESQFNVAELASTSSDMNYMAKVLVKRIKADKRVNVERDWKLVTMMFGANDFCSKFCHSSPAQFRNAAEAHRRDLISTLDYLRDNLPRTIINLVLAPNLNILDKLTHLSSFCDEWHLITCPCLFGRPHSGLLQANFAKQMEYRQVQRQVANDVRYQRKPDFAVVLQPFTDTITFSDSSTRQGRTINKSMFGVDCFHFSQKANAKAANALWNNMLEPIGNKTEGWTETFSRFLCPTKEHPYIFTYGNSYPNSIRRRQITPKRV